MKLFISQPMAGKTDEEILSERKKALESAKRVLETEDIEEIDSYIQGAPSNATPLWYLGESIKKLSHADAVYFVKGWQDARGCQIEHTCAMAYGIDKIIADL